MNNNNIFRKSATFKLNGNMYTLFVNGKNKRTYLKIKNNGKYTYPSYEELTMIFEHTIGNSNGDYVLFSDQKKYRFIPKIRKNAILVALTSSIALSALTGCSNAHEINANNYASFYDLGDYKTDDDNQSLEMVENQSTIDGYIINDDYSLIESTKFLELFNSKYFDSLFGTTNNTLEEVISTVNSNTKLDEKYKKYIIEIVKKMVENYPTIDLRVLNENLKTMTVVVESAADIELDSGGMASYNMRENTMTISEDLDYENNERSQIIFNHEVYHMLNNYRADRDGYQIRYTFNDGERGMYIKEGIDVIISSKPYLNTYSEQEKENLGYALTTNIVSVLIESLPNYSIEDSIDNNIYYLQDKIDEYATENELSGEEVIELIEYVSNEYYDDDFELSDNDRAKLYKFISQLYIKSNSERITNVEDIQNLRNELIDKLEKGVKENAKIDTETIYKTFDEYIEFVEKNQNVDEVVSKGRNK